jgi:hypothetical protein
MGVTIGGAWSCTVIPACCGGSAQRASITTGWESRLEERGAAQSFLRVAGGVRKGRALRLDGSHDWRSVELHSHSCVLRGECAKGEHYDWMGVTIGGAWSCTVIPACCGGSAQRASITTGWESRLEERGAAQSFLRVAGGVRKGRALRLDGSHDWRSVELHSHSCVLRGECAKGEHYDWMGVTIGGAWSCTVIPACCGGSAQRASITTGWESRLEERGAAQSFLRVAGGVRKGRALRLDGSHDWRSVELHSHSCVLRGECAKGEHYDWMGVTIGGAWSCTVIPACCGGSAQRASITTGWESRLEERGAAQSFLRVAGGVRKGRALRLDGSHDWRSVELHSHSCVLRGECAKGEHYDWMGVTIGGAWSCTVIPACCGGSAQRASITTGWESRLEERGAAQSFLRVAGGVRKGRALRLDGSHDWRSVELHSHSCVLRGECAKGEHYDWMGVTIGGAWSCTVIPACCGGSAQRASITTGWESRLEERGAAQSFLRVAGGVRKGRALRLDGSHDWRSVYLRVAVRVRLRAKVPFQGYTRCTNWKRVCHFGLCERKRELQSDATVHHKAFLSI